MGRPVRHALFRSQMIQAIGKRQFALMFTGAASRIREEHARLSELDSISGDGDHGSTMLRTVEQLERSCVPDAKGSLTDTFREAGWNVMNVDGGASSSLLGSFFGGMGDAPSDAAEMDCAALAAAFESGLQAAFRQTKARPGDKTMVDALVPAVAALRAAADSGIAVEPALRAAAARPQPGRSEEHTSE